MTFFRGRLAGSEIIQALASSSIMVFLQVGGALASLAYTLVLVRLLTPEQFGAASSLWALSMLLVPLATLNLASVAIRAVVRARQAKDDALAAGFILFTRRTILVTAPIAMATFMALVWIKYPQIPAMAPVGIWLTAVSIVGWAYVQTGAAIGVSLNQAVRAQIPRLLLRPVMLLAALLVISAFGWTLDLDTALGLVAGATVLVLVFQRFLLSDALSFYRAQTPRIENPWNWVSTGAYLLPTRIVNEHAKSLMIVFSSFVLPLEDIAVLSVALSITGLFDFAITAVEMSFSARLSHALHAEQKARVTKFLAVAGVAKMALSAVMVLVILFLLEPVLTFYGEHYSGAKEVTLTLILVPIFKSLLGNANLVLLVHDLRNRIFWLQLGTLVILPLGALAALALPSLDPMRATSAGFVIAFLIGFTGLWWIAKRRTGIDTSVPGALVNWLRDRRTG